MKNISMITFKSNLLSNYACALTYTDIQNHVQLTDVQSP